MEKFTLEIFKDNETYNFQVVDYLHHEHDHCKFELFDNEKLLASFEPDKYGHLHVCKNPGNINQGILHAIADKLESFNWNAGRPDQDQI